jgi:hypothetical protein
MPIPNAETDLTDEERAMIQSVEEDAVDFGNATPRDVNGPEGITQNPEKGALVVIYRALKGRGVKRPIQEFLAIYRDPENKAHSFDPTFVARDEIGGPPPPLE